MTDFQDKLTLLSDLISLAKSKGADAADALLSDQASLSADVRKGALEKLERSEGANLGLRVFIGKQQAMVSSKARDRQALEELAERAVAMAKATPEDPYCGLADPDQLAQDFPDLDAYDTETVDAHRLTEQAQEAEEAMLAVQGVTNTDGASASWGEASISLVASNGFAQSYVRSSSSLSASALAGGEGDQGMETDYDYEVSVFRADLPAPASVGQSAGERVVRRLGATKGPSKTMSVIYDPRVARSILGHLTGAINGAGVARGTSFLKDKLGERIFKEGIFVEDDPLLKRGLRSHAFDAEGLPSLPMTLIEDGVLTTWIMDLRSARQLGMESSGRASRGASSPPSSSPANVSFTPGEASPDDLMADIKDGLYITDLFGSGVNGVTGDYSRGAAGFWIENGEVKGPASEITVAGNLKDMFLNMTPANDLTYKYGMDAPTLRIDGLTVAGQ